MNRLDRMQKIYLDDITVEDLVTMKYTKPVEDCVVCPKCKNIIDKEMNIDSYGLDDDEYQNMDYDDFDDLDDDGVNKITCPYCNHTTYANRFHNVWTEDIIDAPNCEEILPGIKKAYDEIDEKEENNKKEGVIRMNKNTNKENLQEATIKLLYDGLDDEDSTNDVEGIIDDVLVVTDPEITTDEYDELINRAQEIVEDTPKGEIPMDPTYLGEYVQICPICGGSFIEDHVFEPGTACPICYETPESFVLFGKLEAEDNVAEDSGLENQNIEDNATLPDELEQGNAQEDTKTQDIEEPIEDDNVDSEDTDEKTATNDTALNDTKKGGPVRGARQRLSRDVASKQILSSNNILNENSKKEERLDPEEHFEIDDEMAKSIDGIEVGSIVASYREDTNTVVFYDFELSDDIDTIVYRNQTPEEIKKYMQELLDFRNLKNIKEEKEITDKEDYKLVELNSQEIDSLLENDALVWEGMNLEEYNLKDVVSDLKENTDIKMPIKFYTWTGKIFNEKYELTGENKYPDDLNFLAVEKNNWENTDSLTKYKVSVGARWLSDIISNNSDNQDEIE